MNDPTTRKANQMGSGKAGKASDDFIAGVLQVMNLFIRNPPKKRVGCPSRVWRECVVFFAVEKAMLPFRALY